MEQIKECFHLALRNLRSRSLRSWLTILGIVIGIFLVISLLSLSEGINQAITQQLRALGGEVLFVMPGDYSDMISMLFAGARLERADIEAIKRTRGVEEVLTMSYQSLVVRHEDEGKTVFITGLSWKEGIELMGKFQGWSLKEGRWPVLGRREIIIGSRVETDIFGKKIRVGDEITIKGRRFEVVGVLNSLGSAQDDSSLWLDMSLYQELTGEKAGTAQIAMVKIEEGLSPERVAEDLRLNLEETRKRRAGADEADFSVITSEAMGDIAGSILSIIQLAVVAFASIAIVIGGIGITNTMFTSVRERTREIGIMKAIGAKNSAVLSIFLIEAAIIGLIGGVGGIFLGSVFAKAIASYGQAQNLMYFTAAVTPGLIIFGLVFSLIVGCLAGFFPARKAARLKPVDALRRFE